MLSKREAEALYKWYSRPQVLEKTKRLLDREEYEELEEYLHMTCLFPLSRHSELPDYMRDDDGAPLFPDNLNPKKDLEKWQDAVEVAWKVVLDEFGITHDEVHRKIANMQKQDWEAFLESVERRKKERESK